MENSKKMCYDGATKLLRFVDCNIKILKSFNNVKYFHNNLSFKTV